jgi:histidinol-phosphatase (PHP family)
VEANRLRAKYGDRIALPIAFESEWIRPSTLGLIKTLQSKFDFDMFVGSLHHVHTIPIDFSRAMYEQARQVAGGSDERLFEDYFDSQLDMLHALKPPVVGHFDLIRLLSDDPDGSFQKFSGVWSRAMRNLDFVASYGGLLELNTAALRKGMKEPYPKGDICRVCTSHMHTRSKVRKKC